ncbi:MAG: oxidase [Thermoanaerobaculia bacterium]|nr:oxidase [Thermoanaerobaculia bacterium]
MSDHKHSLMPYVWVLIVLFILTAVTVGAAVINFGHPWSDLVALAIAMTKATLVVLFFMHVKGASRLVKLAAASGFFWLLIFFAFLLSDTMTRGFSYVGGP